MSKNLTDMLIAIKRNKSLIDGVVKPSDIPTLAMAFAEQAHVTGIDLPADQNEEQTLCIIFERSNVYNSDAIVQLMRVLANTKITKLTVNLMAMQFNDTKPTLKAFIDSLPNTHIHTFELLGAQCSDYCVQTLSESKQKSNITNLILTNSNLTYTGLNAMKNAPTIFFKNLTHFSIRIQYMLDENSVSTLAELLNDSNITNLALNLCHLAITNPLFAVLPHTKITALNLSGNKIQASDMEKLAKVLPLTKITNLNVSDTQLEPQETITLARVLPLTQITELDLHKNNITNINVQSAAKILPITTIAKLNVGVQALAEFLPYTKITKLNVSHNKLGTPGIIVLAQALPNTITELNVSYNEFGSQAMEALAQALPSTQITDLNLHMNYIMDEGTRTLAKVLPSLNITTLNISGNKLGTPGIIALAEVLPNTKITELMLYNMVTKEDNFNIAANRSIAALTEALLNPDTKLTTLTMTADAESINIDVMTNFYHGLINSKIKSLDCHVMAPTGNFDKASEFTHQLTEFIINNNITIEISINGNKINNILYSRLTEFNQLLQEQGMEYYSKLFGLELCRLMNYITNYKTLKVFVEHNIALFPELYDTLLLYPDPSPQGELTRMLDVMITQHHNLSEIGYIGGILDQQQDH